jgi:hypothetical protein
MKRNGKSNFSPFCEEKNQPTMSDYSLQPRHLIKLKPGTVGTIFVQDNCRATVASHDLLPLIVLGERKEETMKKVACMPATLPLQPA